MTAHRQPRAAIVGAGFGGLWAAWNLVRYPVEVLLIDRHNYHCFLPLLYQVAAGELEPEEIAHPVRSILWKLLNVQFLLADVKGVDLVHRMLETDGPAIPHDYLILATGSVSHFFGVPGAAEHAFPSKTLEQGVALRTRILCCFESAVLEPDPERRRRLLTFAIVGGGPTGVEFAGALAELIQGPLVKDFSTLDFREVRVILLEAADGLSDHREVYVIGDLAHVEDGGKPLPMLAPVAMQQGVAAPRNIGRQIAGEDPVPFHYRDSGTMVVIGRNAVAVHLRGRAFSGFPAWVLWLGVHLVKLIGFRNRLLVLINWAWDYLFYEHAVRLILPSDTVLASGAWQCAVRHDTSRETVGAKETQGRQPVMHPLVARRGQRSTAFMSDICDRLADATSPRPSIQNRPLPVV